MNGSRAKSLTFAVALGAVLLGGCEQAPEPTPFPRLPTLQRPVQTIVPPAGDAAVTIPAGAVVHRSGIPGVFVLQQGLARFRMIRTGKTVDGRVQIISGLVGGETLIGGDLTPVHDGSPIRPAQ
jgi:hypothetical protein